MYRKILVGDDGTKRSGDALALARVLARATGGETLTVTAPGEAGEDLARLARDRRAEVVVLGPTHRGPVGRVVPGATAERLLAEEGRAVAVAPAGFSACADAAIRVIGVGFDGSPGSRRALAIASELAVANGAALRVFTVARNYAHLPGGDGDSRGPGVPTEAEILRQYLHDAVAELPAGARAQPVFLRGFPTHELIAASQAGIDLLILGSRSGGPVRRLLHHSVSSIVMAEAGCPVLISPDRLDGGDFRAAATADGGSSGARAGREVGELSKAHPSAL